MHFLFLGILLGMGVAIPLGPINLEMIRRNLHFGTSYGIATGLGACSADVTYLILLCAGALTLLQHPDVLRTFGLCGSLILAWFAFMTFRAKISAPAEKKSRPSLYRYIFEGYLITLINPMTILFWGSVSSQVSLIAMNNHFTAIVLTGLGVAIGTVGWVLSINTLLHFTRHKFSKTTMKVLNIIGGTILLGFALAGFLKAL